MRLRAFPQSFWQQPNQPVGVSPAVCHKVLPPLAMKDEFGEFYMRNVFIWSRLLLGVVYI